MLGRLNRMGIYSSKIFGRLQNSISIESQNSLCSILYCILKTCYSPKYIEIKMRIDLLRQIVHCLVVTYFLGIGCKKACRSKYTDLVKQENY